MKNTTTVKDPVCGMDIETATAAGRTEHAGQTYYFCGSKCKDKFDRDPDNTWASLRERRRAARAAAVRSHWYQAIIEDFSWSPVWILDRSKECK